MESFEITFFCDKRLHPDSTDSSCVLKELYSETVRLENEVLFDTVDYDDNDFFERNCARIQLYLIHLSLSLSQMDV